MTLSKEKLGDCPPPPPLYSSSPPASRPHPAMATHQPLYQHRIRVQQQSTEDDAGVKMACAGRSYEAGGGGGGTGVPATAASLIHQLRPPWHIKDEVLPQIHSHDEFEEWPNGYIQKAYSASCPDAKGHQSGWAMRNTNNHDPKRLKKSCLGVMMCSQKCINDDGFMVHIRPYICDKARRKQEGIRCPTKGCDGHLFQVRCSGHAGKPVTHIWRTEGNTIFFQAKGEHCHPAPEPKMSVNARRLVASRNRPPHHGTIRRISKTRGNRKTNRTNHHSTSQMALSSRSRDMMPVFYDGFYSPSLALDYHPDMSILALQQQHQQQATAGTKSCIGSLAASGHLPSTTVAFFNSSAAAAQFIARDDFPPPPPPPPPSHWYAEHEMAPPGGSCPSSIDGVATCRSAYFSFDDLCSMAVSPGTGGALQDAPGFKDYAVIHGSQQSPVSTAFFLPPLQSSYACDPGSVLGDEYLRCTSGSGESEKEAGARIVGSPPVQGLVGAANGMDGYLSELDQARQLQARWLTSSCDMSPLHHSPHHSPTALCQYPTLPYRSQLEPLQSHQRTTKSSYSISLQRPYQQQQQQQQQQAPPPLSPPFDHHHLPQAQQPPRAIAGIVGLGTPAATAVYFGGSDYLPNSAIVRL